MNSKWLGRLPALTGAIFAIIALVRGGGNSAAPTESSTGQQIADYAFHHPHATTVYHLELVAFLAVMMFTVVLYSRLRPAEPRFAVAAQIAVAACVISVAIKLGSSPAFEALFSSPVQLDPGLARSLFLINYYSFSAAMLIQALSLGAVAVSGLLFGGIPRWLAGTAGVVAVALAVGFTVGGNFHVAPTLAWILWLLVASVTLFVQGPRAAGDEQPARTAFATSAAGG